MSKSRIAESKNVGGPLKSLLIPISKIYEDDFDLNTESICIPALYSPGKKIFASIELTVTVPCVYYTILYYTKQGVIKNVMNV